MVESLGFRYGSFRKLGVPYFGALIIYGSCYLGYYLRVPYFRKVPYRGGSSGCGDLRSAPAFPKLAEVVSQRVAQPLMSEIAECHDRLQSS